MSEQGDYPEHSIKKDPGTQLLAMRSAMEGDKAWRVYPPNVKPHFVSHDAVEAWTDFVEAEPEP